MRILIILVALVGISETASGQAVPLASSEGLESNNREYLFKVRLTINEPACICSLSFDGSNRGLDFGEVQIPSAGEIEKTISPSDPEAVRLLGIHRNCDGAIGYGASVEPEFQFQGPGVSFEKRAFNKFSGGNLKLSGGFNEFRIRWLLSFARRFCTHSYPFRHPSQSYESRHQAHEQDLWSGRSVDDFSDHLQGEREGGGGSRRVCGGGVLALPHLWTVMSRV